MIKTAAQGLALGTHEEQPGHVYNGLCEGFASRLLSGKVMTDESGLFETRSGCEKGRWREPRRDALGAELRATSV